MAKRLFSGIQPSGALHLGNYLGAILNFVELQKKYDSYFSIVNYHAITVPQDPKELRANTRLVANTYLAAGVNPEQSTIFVQSEVSEHTELAWILNNFTYFGEASRMTQFKEKGSNQTNITVGLFDYPVLMAADILIYDTAVVPVGEDQKQHVELARDIAERFNKRFGKTFIVPEPLMRKEGARIKSLIDPLKKMSKSDTRHDSVIFLSDSPDEIRRKIMNATTDSGTEVKFNEKEKPGISNLLTIHSLFSGMPTSAIEKVYVGKGYGEFKKGVAEVVIDGLATFQERLGELQKDSMHTDKILQEGAKRAQAVAFKKLSEVKKKIGVGN